MTPAYRRSELVETLREGVALAGALAEPAFLEAVVSELGVDALLDGFARAGESLPAHLGLAREAIARRRELLQQHPRTLFQAVWNLCAWPLAPETDLTRWLQGWRAWKDEHDPEHVWLRSLRPPASPLDGALVTTLPEARSVVALPSGLLAGLRSGRGPVRLWDRCGRDLGELPSHEGPFQQLHVAGSRLLVATQRGVEVWDAEARERLCVHPVAVVETRTRAEHSTRCAYSLRVPEEADEHTMAPEVSVSADGAWALTHTPRSNTKLWWEVETGETLATITEPCVQPFFADGLLYAAHEFELIAFSPDGEERLRRVFMPMHGNEFEALPPALDPQQKRFLYIDERGYHQVMPLDEVDPPFVLDGPEDLTWPTASAWSPDGTRVATAEVGSVLRVWDPDYGGQEWELTLPSDPNRDVPITDLAWGPLGLAAVVDGCVVFLVDPARGKVVRQLRGDPDLAFERISLSGTQLVTNTGFVWDLGRTAPGERTEPSPDLLTMPSYAPDRSRVALATVDGRVLVLDTETGESLATHVVAGVRCSSWTPDSVCVGTTQGEVLQLDPQEGVATRYRGHQAAIEALATGQGCVAAGDRDGVVCLWDFGRDEPRWSTTGGSHVDLLFFVGRRLVAYRECDSTLEVLDSETGAVDQRFEQVGGFRQLCDEASYAPFGAEFVSLFRHYAADEEGSILLDPSHGRVEVLPLAPVAAYALGETHFVFLLESHLECWDRAACSRVSRYAPAAAQRIDRVRVTGPHVTILFEGGAASRWEPVAEEVTHEVDVAPERLRFNGPTFRLACPDQPELEFPICLSYVTSLGAGRLGLWPMDGPRRPFLLLEQTRANDRSDPA